MCGDNTHEGILPSGHARYDNSPPNVQRIISTFNLWFQRYGTQPTTNLDGLGRELEEARADGHSTRVLVVQGSQESRRLAPEILLVVDKALREERNVAFHDVVDDRPVAAVLFQRPYASPLQWCRTSAASKQRMNEDNVRAVN